MDPPKKGPLPGRPEGLPDEDPDEQVRLRADNARDDRLRADGNVEHAEHLRGDEQIRDGLRANPEREDGLRAPNFDAFQPDDRLREDDLRAHAEQIRRERVEVVHGLDVGDDRLRADGAKHTDADVRDEIRRERGQVDVDAECANRQQADIDVHVDGLRADHDAVRARNFDAFQSDDRLRVPAVRGAEAVRGQHDNVDVADAGQGLRDQHVTVRGHERGAALHGEDDLSLFAPLAFGNEEAGAVPRFGYGNHARREVGIGIRSSTSDSNIGPSLQVDARVPMQQTEVNQEELSRALEGVHLQEHGRDPVHEDGAERGQPQHALAGEDALGQVAPAAHVDADGEVDELQLGDDAASVERRGRGINYAASISDFDDDEDIGLTAMFERSRNIVNTLEADLRPWKDIILNPNQRPTVHTVEMGINIFSRRARELAECLRWAILRFEFLEEEFSQEEIQRQLDVITFGRQWSRDLYSLFCEINSNVSLKDKALAKTFVRAADLLAATAFQNALAYAHKSGFEEPEFELRSYHSVGTASTASGITASLRRRGRLNTIFSDAEKLDIRVAKKEVTYQEYEQSLQVLKEMENEIYTEIRIETERRMLNAQDRQHQRHEPPVATGRVSPALAGNLAEDDVPAGRVHQGAAREHEREQANFDNLLRAVNNTIDQRISSTPRVNAPSQANENETPRRAPVSQQQEVHQQPEAQAQVDMPRHSNLLRAQALRRSSNIRFGQNTIHTYQQQSSRDSDVLTQPSNPCPRRGLEPCHGQPTYSNAFASTQRQSMGAAAPFNPLLSNIQTAVPQPGTRSENARNDRLERTMAQAFDMTKYLGENMATMAQAVSSLTANHGRGNNTADGSEIMEQFNKTEFYAALPTPWNVYPRTTGKVGDERNLIKQYLGSAGSGAAKIEPFNGDEAKYFTWRPSVIEIIHKANLPVADKYMQLKLCFKEGVDTTLDVYIENKEASKESYALLIQFIENTWGGQDRAYLWAETKIMSVRKLNTSLLESISCVWAELQRFIRFCESNGLADRLSQTTIVGKIIKRLMSEETVNDMLDKHQEGILAKDPNSLYLVEEFLANLARARTRKNLLLGRQRKPASGVPDARGGRYGHVGVGEDNEDEPAEAETRAELSSTAVENYIDVDESNAHVDDNGITHVNLGKFNGKPRLPRYPFCELCKSKNAKPKFPRHFLFTCEVFQGMKVIDRMEYVKGAKRCFNCLGPNHSTEDCVSSGRCRHCSKKHNTLLCKQGPPKEGKEGK